MPQSSEEKRKLKQLVSSIIVAQGNVFIKELLRNKQREDARVTIGTNKEQFEANLAKAIDDDVITRDDIAQWLALTEGWGGQHVYLYQGLPARTPAALRQAIEASRYKKLLLPSESMAFPDELKLTAIVVDNERLLLTWHRGSTWYSRDKKQDDTKTVGLNHYQMRAYLEHRDRAVVRFEWRFDRAFCGLFVQLPQDDPAYDRVFDEAWEVLTTIGAAAARQEPAPLVNAVRNLGDVAGVVERGSTWRVSGGYVDVQAQVDGGIAAVGPLARARLGINEREFGSADGEFDLPTTQAVPGAASRLRFLINGSNGRIRITSQCRREQVYELVDAIWQQNT